MTDKKCVFCTLPPERILGENAHAVWIRDGYPVSLGHSLVISKRHVGSFFEASHTERCALLELLDQAKTAADAEFGPSCYNVGINDGPSAEQTAMPRLHKGQQASCDIADSCF